MTAPLRERIARLEQHQVARRSYLESYLNLIELKDREIANLRAQLPELVTEQAARWPIIG